MIPPNSTQSEWEKEKLKPVSARYIYIYLLLHHSEYKTAGFRMVWSQIYTYGFSVMVFSGDWVKSNMVQNSQRIKVCFFKGWTAFFKNYCNIREILTQFEFELENCDPIFDPTLGSGNLINTEPAREKSPTDAKGVTANSFKQISKRVSGCDCWPGEQQRQDSSGWVRVSQRPEGRTAGLSRAGQRSSTVCMSFDATVGKRFLYA